MAHRVDHSTRLVDANGAGKDGYTDGEPGVTPATILTADYMNDLQEQVCQAIEGHGDTLVKLQFDQLLTCFRRASMHSLMTFGALLNDGSSNLDNCKLLRHGQGSPGVWLAFPASGTNVKYRDTSGGWATGSALGIDPVDAKYGTADALWVAVAAAAGIETAATAGGAWTARTAAAGYAGDFTSVVYAEPANRFVLGGTVGEIQTADAGTAYVRRKNGGNTIVDMAQNGSDVVVAVEAAARWRSTDGGVTWGASAAMPIDGITTVAYHPKLGVFVAHGHGGANPGTAWSADGDSWTRVETTALNASSSNRMYAIGGGFALVSNAAVIWFTVLPKTIGAWHSVFRPATGLGVVRAGVQDPGMEQISYVFTSGADHFTCDGGSGAFV